MNPETAPETDSPLPEAKARIVPSLPPEVTAQLQYLNQAQLQQQQALDHITQTLQQLQVHLHRSHSPSSSTSAQTPCSNAIQPQPGLSTPPAFPPRTVASINALLSRPNQPSWVSRTLLPLATFTNNPTIDTAQLLADSLWVSIAENSSPGLPRSSPSTYRRSTSSGRGRLISFEGRQLYISNAGRTFDTSQPPPYNCYRCGGTHWAIHCTAQNSSPAGGSGSNLSGSFSARSNTPNF